MIAKAGWFVRRKYGGWGFWPKTWQAWVYLVVLLLPWAGIQYLKDEALLAGLIAWAVFLFAGFWDINASIHTDERERIHEAIAERNALWAIVLVLAVGVAYQAAASAMKGQMILDPVILAALIVGVLVKAASNIYLDRKD